MIGKFFKLLFKSIIIFYQYGISPYLGKNCRFTPSCSEYGKNAIEKYGAAKGGIMTIKRISRCHPWGGSGYDPVP